nr:hypothetical protein [Tanacetum cinerariifolium]
DKLSFESSKAKCKKIEKVILDSEASSLSSDEKIAEVSYYTSESESKSEYETSDFYENLIESQIDYNESDVTHNDSKDVAKKQIADQEILFDKISYQLVELDENVRMLKNTILEKETKTSELEGCVSNKDLEIEKCLERLNDCENKLHKIRETNQTIHMIMPSKDTLYNCRKGIDTFSCVRRPKHIGVIWKKKWSSNTFNVDLSSVSHLKLNKDVKRYSRKDLLSCNNSHLGETSSAYVYNDAMNVSCNSRLCDSFDENNLFIFDDESVRNSQVSKMPFRKTTHASLNVIGSGCSKHMTGNRALLTNFVEKFLGTVRFGNNDVAVIVGYGDVVIGSMTIKQELMNKRKPNIKFFHVFGCKCYLLNDYDDVGKLKTKRDIGVFVGYSKESASFRIYNKRTRKIHESVNVNFDEISEMASKQFSLEPGLSNLNETGKSSNPLVSQVSETSMKDLEYLFQIFYDEYFDSSKIMKSSTTNVETSNVEIPSHEEEVFHESSESFQEESSSSSLNENIQQSSKEVRVPSSNTQSVLNNMVPNVDEASTSHIVFNERLEDAYFDTSTSFHDPSNVHTFYQPYPHEKKWTKDHPLHKIIGDPKSSVRTRESEYVTVSGCCAQVLWMRTQLTDYDFFYDKVPIYCDSKSAIAISSNPIHHTRTKHIDVSTKPKFKEKKVYASVHLSLKKKRSLL